jgi:hypothetical protein
VPFESSFGAFVFFCEYVPVYLGARGREEDGCMVACGLLHQVMHHIADLAAGGGAS